MEISKIFGVSLDHLINSDLTRLPEKEWKSRIASKSKEVLTITVDSNNKENVELVPTKAFAGYTAGYQDPEFIRDLQKMSIPMLPRNRTHRAFEIKGDSMLPIQAGTVIFGEYVEDVESIKNGKLYILITKQDGIVFKRVFNFADQQGRLLLVSDNRAYEPYAVNAEDVLEIWAAKALYSTQFPEIDASASLVDQLALQLFQLQREKGKTKGK